MRFSVLGSGSKGNCTLVESGTTRILVDAGFSGKEIVKRLEMIARPPESLNAILVTHEHNDHINGVGVLSRRFGLPVFANPGTHGAAGNKVGKLSARLEFQTGECFAVDGLQIHPFSVSHDTVDPVGFVFNDGSRRLGYCTDTGKITKLISHHLGRCHALILEANHDVEMLRQGPYPLPLQQRVLSKKGHLSNIDAVDFALQLAENGLRYLVLAHLSEVNNHPDVVTRAVEDILAGSLPDLKVKLAHQQLPGELIAVEE